MRAGAARRAAILSPSATRGWSARRKRRRLAFAATALSAVFFSLCLTILSFFIDLSNPAQASPTLPQVSVGSSAVCGGVETGGSLECWGTNSVTPPSTGTFTQVSVGDNYSGSTEPNFSACAVDTGNHVTCWGDNAFGEQTYPQGSFQQVSDGIGTVCALKVDATVVCWGDPSTHITPGPPSPESSTDFTQVSTGSDAACGIVQTTNAVYCWGDDTYEPSGSFQQVSVGVGLACAVATGGGSITCWGNNGSPSSVSGHFQQVSVGGNSRGMGWCAVATDGALFCFGNAPFPGGGTDVGVRVGDSSTCVTHTNETVKLHSCRRSPRDHLGRHELSLSNPTKQHQSPEHRVRRIYQ